jgi:hypothetical protein
MRAEHDIGIVNLNFEMHDLTAFLATIFSFSASIAFEAG